MDKTQFIRDARDENPDATYAEVNKAWKKACEEKGYQSPRGPNIGPIAWRWVAIGYTNGTPQTNKVEWRPSPLGDGVLGLAPLAIFARTASITALCIPAARWISNRSG